MWEQRFILRWADIQISSHVSLELNLIGGIMQYESHAMSNLLFMGDNIWLTIQ